MWVMDRFRKGGDIKLFYKDGMGVDFMQVKKVKQKNS
jgi:hypothetical protein